VLTAHFFIFYFAVMSAITPPVALAAYAGAALAGSDPMRTSVESFKIGLAAFVVPFMFFYSPRPADAGDAARRHPRLPHRGARHLPVVRGGAGTSSGLGCRDAGRARGRGAGDDPGSPPPVSTSSRSAS
jgi:hypothetical protein